LDSGNRSCIDSNGKVKAWVQVCSLSVPIDEPFPGGETEFAAGDNGFSRIPEPEVHE